MVAYKHLRLIIIHGDGQNFPVCLVIVDHGNDPQNPMKAGKASSRHVATVQGAQRSNCNMLEHKQYPAIHNGRYHHTLARKCYVLFATSPRGVLLINKYMMYSLFCMHLHLCTYVHTHIYVYIYICIYIYICRYIRTYRYACVCICVLPFFPLGTSSRRLRPESLYAGDGPHWPLPGAQLDAIHRILRASEVQNGTTGSHIQSSQGPTCRIGASPGIASVGTSSTTHFGLNKPSHAHARKHTKAGRKAGKQASMPVSRITLLAPTRKMSVISHPRHFSMKTVDLYGPLLLRVSATLSLTLRRFNMLSAGRCLRDIPCPPRRVLDPPRSVGRLRS